MKPQISSCSAVWPLEYFIFLVGFAKNLVSFYRRRPTATITMTAVLGIECRSWIYLNFVDFVDVNNKITDINLIESLFTFCVDVTAAAIPFIIVTLYCPYSSVVRCCCHIFEYSYKGLNRAQNPPRPLLTNLDCNLYSKVWREPQTCVLHFFGTAAAVALKRNSKWKILYIF
jgi:hypothetical protein